MNLVTQWQSIESMIIRNVNKADYAQIKQLNDEFVHFTSPMDIARISQLDQWACYHKVVERKPLARDESKLLGFLLAMPGACQYDSENYQWFNRRYNDFIYVDRIVIRSQEQSSGLGHKLYEELFQFARQQHIAAICCEYNLVPENRASERFHQSFGFQPGGQISSRNSDKVVSLQMVRLD
ncbi:GNAT family N-acetyltransferase [Aliiglaciecola sp. LCG003]|uniref:GNAT family N-acetyltransferase n=1 Tax=Aliiglaciecola sp. LCG003 TaxID=3053655 RepID=UPI002573E119|nr:GNAT family N-acetyltransferase [Aliiglaciecola sp. LCG003]WJG09794.1 GNAT family N-acetyltransferase [Aliiglaciecola sp. LCG003]